MDCPDEDEIVAYAGGQLVGVARARVAEHLDACPICVGLVAEAARGPDTRAELDAAWARSPVPSRGTALGRYLVLEPLGSGGLGHVVAAYDPQLDRRVAIKLLEPQAHRGRSPAELRARLLREAQALAKVRHPNVVAVHDVGVVDDPAGEEQVFLAMELVEGATLREWLAERDRGWHEIREVFVAAARGLAAAHDAGLVHRDVKPGNILVGRDGRVHLADFGLARALDRDGRSAPTMSPTPVALDVALTASGAIVGTPAYMAPEQHRGERVDGRTDQFGLCVALFEALWRTRPFIGTSVGELREACANDRVVDVPAAGVPGWLRRVVLRGLASDPNARFASMRALELALQSDLRGRRWRTAVLGLGMLGCGAALAAIWIDPAPSIAAVVDDTVARLTNEARAAAARAHFAHPEVTAPDAPTAFTKVLELEGLSPSDHPDASARALELRQEFATTLVGLGDRYWDVEGGRPFAAEYYAAALVFDDAQPRALARIGVSVAALVALRERAAAAAFTEFELVAAAPVLALATDDAEARDRILADAYAREPEPPAALTAALQTVLGEPGRAAIDRGRALREPLRASPMRAQAAARSEDPPRVTGERGAVAGAATPTRARGAARGHVDDGKTALARGDLEAAAAAFHRALAVDRNDTGALSGLAEVAFQRRSYDAAIDYLERALGVAPRRASLHLDLGDVYFKVLRYDDARMHYQRARELGDPGAARRIARLDARLGGSGR